MKPALLGVVTSLGMFGCMFTGGTPMGVEVKTFTQFESSWRAYQKLDGLGFKALAVAGDRRGTHVTGYAYAYPTQDTAIQDAIQYCEMRRADRRIEAPCVLYAMGDETVE